MPMSLPEDLVEQARREREQQALSPITSSIDRMIREGMGGIESIAKGAAEQAAPVVKLLQGGELKLPTLDDLTPQWMRDQYEPKPVQQPMVQPQQQAPASGMPQAMPTAPQDGQQAQAAQRPMALPTGSEGGDYGPIDNSSRAAFVRTAYPYMLEAAGGDKNLAELMLAKAISENGDVGSGGGFIGNNFSGIKGEGDAGSFEADTWEDYGNGRVNIRDRFAAYSTPQVGFRAFMQFLHDNSRYAPALARYQQTGDASQLFRDIRAAGYATDPLWADKVENIRANQVAPIVRGQADQDMQRLSLNAVPAAAPGRTAPPAPAGVASAPAGAPPAPWETAGASDGGALLLKENDETAPMGGGDAMLPGDGGFAPMQGSAPGMEGSAAIYDARDADSGPRESRPAPILPTDPTVSDLAYTQSPTGMSYGPIQQGAVQGPPAPERPYLEQATDWVQRTAAPLVEAATNAYGREISEGNRVQDEIDAALDAKSNEFANMVRAPIDDVRRGVNIANRVLMATPQATADVVNAALERFGLGRDALGVDLPLVGRIGIADIVDLGPTSNIGMGRTGMVQRPVQSIVPNVGGAIEDVAGAGIRAAREGIRTGAEALGRGLQGVGREVAGGLMDLNPAMTPRVIGDGGPGIGRAMTDGAGEAATIGRGGAPVEPPRVWTTRSTADTFDPEWAPEGFLEQAGIPIAAPRRPKPDDDLFHLTSRDNLERVAREGLTPTAGDERATDILLPDGSRTVRRPAVYAADNAPILSTVDRDMAGTVEWSVLRFKRGNRGWRKDPEFATDPGSWVTRRSIPAAEIEVLTSDGWRPVTEVGRERVSPEAGIPTTRDDTPRSPGLNSAPAYNGRGAGIGAQAAADVGANLQGGVVGAAAGYGMPADSEEERRQNALYGAGAGMVGMPIAGRVVGRGMRGGGRGTRLGIIPPHVADQMGDTFPVRIPEDPKAIRAIESIGGTIDPERGVTINVTRAQGPQAAGQAATRGGVFYEAVPPGGKSDNFVRQSDDPTGVGGSQVIPARPTRFRSPLIVSDAPGGKRGFDEAMRQMRRDILDQVESEYDAAQAAYDAALAAARQDASPAAQQAVEAAKRDLRAASQRLADAGDLPEYDVIEQGIRRARRAGPEGSEARAQALKDLVRTYGGDEDLIEPLLRVRGAEAGESEWAIRENILAAHARRNGYDGVVTVQSSAPTEADILAHPEVVKWKAILQEARQELNALYDRRREMLASGGPWDSPPPSMEEIDRAKRRVDLVQDKYQAVKDAAMMDPSLVRSNITELVDVREGANPTPGAPNPKIVEAEQRLAEVEARYRAEEAKAKAEYAQGIKPSQETLMMRGDLVGEYSAAQNAVRDLRASEPHSVGDPGFSVRADIQRPPGAQWAGVPFDPTSAAMGGAAGAMSEGEDGERGDPLRTAAGIGLGAFGARIARKPGHTVATGLKPGQRYEFRVRVVPLRDLITSHLDNLAENPGFLGELQPRVRSRAASRVQIDKMVQAFDPEQVLMDTHRVDSGPMIVGPDMMVESGNGRAIALRRLSQENPEAYADYVQALREELPYYGLTEDALKGIDQPVLVRERVTPLDPAERARFASEANAPTAAQMSSMEQALADARNIGDGPLGRIVVGEDQTIDEALLSPENGAFVRAFMATVPDTERGKMLEANGNLSVTGLARVKAALLARTYPGAAGERVATAIVESTDAGLRNVQNAVMGSLPSMARVEGLIAAGDVDAGLSLADDIAAAVDVYARLKRAGILVGDYLQQAGMFGGRETTPLQDAILGYLNENARAPRRLRSLLEGYAREVEATAGSAGDMFGGPAPAATKEEVLDGVLRRLGAAPGADQGADVGRTGAAGNLVEGAAGRPIQVPGADSGAQAGRGAGGPSLLDDVAAAENLTPEQQIARLQAENDRLRAERRGGGRRQQPPQAAPIGDANLPPVGDDLIPPTGGEAGRLQVEGASQPAPRPGPVGDILPRTGGPEGTLAREGAPEPQPRPTPIPRDVLPPTGGPEGVLRQPVATEPQTGPTPFARPTPIPEDAIPATGGPEIRLRVEEDRKAVEQLMADSAGARRYDEQQRRQISEATARYAEDVRTLSQRIEAERAAGNTPDRLMAERAAVANRLHATMLLAEGRRGPAARAFREADRQAALLQRDPKRAVAQMHQRFGGQENAAAAADEYTRMVEDGATPIQLARFWAGVERGKITGADLFGLYRRFNMLSGPRTIEVNALSGALNLGYEVVSQAVGQTARGRGAEAAAEFAAPFKAMGRAFNNLAETMWHGVSAEQAARGDIPRTLSSRTDNRAAKGVLTAMEVPDRFNAAVDQFYRTMTEDWAATMLAHKRARADGLTPRSDGWADAVAKHLQEIRDDVDVLPEIKRMADHVTFAEEPGGIGRGLEEFRRRAPLVANVLFPFIRTPYNIASRAVDLSPLGVVRTGAEVLTGRGRGRENVSRRVRDNALGLAAAYWAYDQAQQGNITGAGPDDPEKLAMLRATGWQPYSVKVGDQYWSYANFAPFSLALSMGAAAHEAKQYAKPGETDTLALLGDAATRTAKVVTDMTVLQGIGAIIKSIQDPDRYGGAWLTQFVGSLVPAGSLLNTIGQATDDTVRRAERDTFANQVSQGVQARIPGLRQQVPAAQDPLGRAVPNDQQGAGALNPFRPTQGRPDSTIQAFLDAGIDIGKPPTSFTVDGVKIEMTPEQQRQYQRYMGEAIEKGIDRAAGASDRLRAQKLKQLLDDARASAAAKVQADIGRSEIRSRVRERRAS